MNKIETKEQEIAFYKSEDKAESLMWDIAKLSQELLAIDLNLTDYYGDLIPALELIAKRYAKNDAYTLTYRDPLYRWEDKDRNEQI